jgi:uncharacterized protein YbaR (Trm112 family)
MIPPDLLEVLACPVCRKPVVPRGEDGLKCNECGRVYPVRNGVPILKEPEAIIEQLLSGPPAGAAQRSKSGISNSIPKFHPRAYGKEYLASARAQSIALTDRQGK